MSAMATVNGPIGRRAYSDSYAALLVDVDRYEFAAWLEMVDQRLETVSGNGVSDLPDIAYRDLYDRGYSAHHAAATALRRSGISWDAMV